MEWLALLKPTRAREQSSVRKMENDTRSPFKKDFDTVCNCTGIRRLQDKAQVFPLERGDYARTRLTHSIEVQSIAESLGVEAVSIIKPKNPPQEALENIEQIPVILRTAAYLHDMGNPPFGHLGEEIIAEWFVRNLPDFEFSHDGKLIFKQTHTSESRLLVNILDEQMKNDFYHFEGNAQLLRLITKLSFITDENGMNLSYPVIATILKYPTKSTEISTNGDVSRKKMGYMYFENALYENIDRELGLGGKRHPLVFLLEAADDIAYLTADIEDAHKKRIFQLDDFLKALDEKKDDPFIKDVLEEADKYHQQWMLTRVPDHDDCIMQRLRIYIKGKMISAVKNAFGEHYQEILDGAFGQELLSVSSAANMVNLIRNDIERKYIYFSDSVIKTKLQSYQIIDTLMDKFVPSVFNANVKCKSDDKDTLAYGLISKNYRFICERACEGKDYDKPECIYSKLLLVTDFISGMTDTYAVDMYHLLTATK